MSPEPYQRPVDVDRFLEKFVLPMERENARRDLAEVVAGLSEDDRFEWGREAGYRRALEDADVALRARITAERMGWWLRDRLREVRGH